MNVNDLSAVEKAALLGGKDTWRSRELPAKGVKSIFFADGPHGVRKQKGDGDHLGINASEPATCFPTSATTANSWDPNLAERIGQALGREARALGVNVLLGPGLNLKRSPLGGRNFEYFSEDPYLAGKMAAGYVRGIQSQGVAATPKHFAVNSQELRRMASNSVIDERTLRELYLTAFEIVTREAHPMAFMSSYNKINGVYSHENKKLLTDILRNEWGFDGIVVSDWGGSNDVIKMVEAGGTIEMPSPGWDSVKQIVSAVESGKLSADSLNARASEMLALIEKLPQDETGAFNVEDHHALAREAAEHSIVLLKNDDAILPLKAGTKIAVIGDMADTPRYQGAGSSQVNPTRLTSPKDALTDSALDVVGFAQGYRRHSNVDLTLENEARELAAKAEVAVVFIGLDEVSESEGADRQSIGLPAAQLSLLRQVSAVNSNVVVVLSAGSCVDTGWVSHTKAVLHGYLSGQAGAEAITNILVGDVNPSGKLAETYPVALSTTPTSDAFPAQGPTSVYREGLFVGYRYAQAAGLTPTFPFGFGLSYTSFDYRDIEITDDGVSFVIENTGQVAGSEIAQLYVAHPDSGVTRPNQELKGFVKVNLAPGEQQKVTIAFDAYTFRHFDIEQNKWVIEAGRWQILIGASSQDIRLRGEIERAGEKVSQPIAPATLREAMLRGLTDDELRDWLHVDVPSSQQNKTMGLNDPLGDLAIYGNWLGRLVYKMLAKAKRKAEIKGEPDLNVLFLYNMPIRAIAKMSNGMVSMKMARGILDALTGHFFKGLGTVIAGFFRNRRLSRSLNKKVEGK